MKELGGILTAMVTPFNERGEIEFPALGPFLDFQRAAGIDGVVVAGTNGEGPSLSVDERKRLFESVIALRGDLLVVAGTGAASITDAIILTRHAGDIGADAALVLPPFYFKNPSARGVAEYFNRVLDSSSIPVLLYSIPQQSAVAITDEVLALLKGHPRLAGLKDSAGEWERTRQLIEQNRELKLFPGSDALLSRVLGAGASGAISGTANAFPDLVVGVRDAYRKGSDVDDAQARLDAARSVLLDYPLVAVNKSILGRRGLPRMWVRPPLVDLTPEQERELSERLRL